MDKITKLELLVEDVRCKLNDYISEGKSEEEIYAISTELDELIVLHNKLRKK